MIERIAILGGSSVYTPEFILSAMSHNLNFKEVVLVGREETRLPHGDSFAALEIVAAFCQRMLDKCGFPAKITATTSVSEGVKGAKYILNNVQIGDTQTRLRDEKLPLKHGMVGDESLGAGGIANALRTLPVVFEFAEQIQKANPDGTFINLAHPMGIIVEALTKYAPFPVIGACDLPARYIKKIAGILHCALSDLSVDYVGLNHMGWIQDVKVSGCSRMGRLLEKLERRHEEGFDHGLIELFRMIPTQTAGLYFNRDEVLKKQRSCARFRADILFETEQQILALYKDEHVCDLPELTRERNAVWYEETITQAASGTACLPILEALEGKTECDLILCVQNGNAVRDLPEESSVEIPVAVSQQGLQPRAVGNCPRFLKGLFTALKESDRLIIEAVRHSSYEYALQALTISPLVPSIQMAKKFLDGVIKEEGLELH